MARRTKLEPHLTPDELKQRYLKTADLSERSHFHVLWLISQGKTQAQSAELVILLTLDGAGWHASANLRVPDGIILEFQPPYSPEVQPAEHLWPLCDEALANESFATIEDLEDRLAARCCVLAGQPDILSSATHFHWWPSS